MITGLTSTNGYLRQNITVGESNFHVPWQSEEQAINDPDISAIVHDNPEHGENEDGYSQTSHLKRLRANSKYRNLLNKRGRFIPVEQVPAILLPEEDAEFEDDHDEPLEKIGQPLQERPMFYHQADGVISVGHEGLPRTSKKITHYGSTADPKERMEKRLEVPVHQKRQHCLTKRP